MVTIHTADFLLPELHGPSQCLAVKEALLQCLDINVIEATHIQSNHVGHSTALRLNSHARSTIGAEVVQKVALVESVLLHFIQATFLPLERFFRIGEGQKVAVLGADCAIATNDGRVLRIEGFRECCFEAILAAVASTFIGFGAWARHDMTDGTGIEVVLETMIGVRPL